jgi:hypothetical protein
MRRMTRTIYITLLSACMLFGTIIGARAASAASMKGNFLLQQCTSSGGPARVTCLAYLLGYVDSTIVWKVNVGGIPVCIPSEADIVEQIADVVVKWLKNHPTDLDQAAGYLMKLILEETWPCRESALQ